MRIFTTLLLLTCSVFVFGKSIPTDATFSIAAIGPTSVCSNDSVNIVATGCSGNIIWNNGNTYNPFAIHAVQAGDYFATCVPTGEVSNIITVTIVSKPSPPTATIDLINNQYVLNASDCSGEILWSTNEITMSIIAKAQGSYFAFCRIGNNPNCVSPPSNTFNITAPIPMIDTRKVKLCVGESTNLISTGCLGTILWNNGMTGTTIQVSSVGSYTASCVQFGIQSSPSNTIVITKLEIEPPLIYSPDNIYCLSPLSPTVTLTTNSCPEGDIIWSNGTTATSITVSVAGTYSAQCQNSCGLSQASNVVTILENEGSIIIPAAPFISASKTSICDRETTILTAIGCNETIIWSNGATGSSITVAQIGSYSAICRNQCSNSESSNIITVQTGIMPASPAISTTKNSLCNGETATLTAFGCSGNILWNNGMTTSVITVTQIGSYTAICQTSGECRDSNPSNPIIINTGTVPSSPLISTNKTILCDNESATLVASGCVGTVWWSTGATTTSIQFPTSGTYTATCRNQCGESGPSNAIILRQGISPTTPTATSNKASICSGETANLIVSGCNGVVIWSNGMTPTSIQISQPGTYTVTCNTICGSAVSNNVVIGAATNTSQAPSITSTKTALCGTENSTLTATGCSGGVIWSNGSTGISITLTAEGSYSAKCQTSCGLSDISNVINIIQLKNQCVPITVRILR